ncbi:histidine phosphatase family protein [Frigidibacter sp. RF13]|uniref:histidine phosphatase family protein n=1 Tax=Frigidibacter sp. RF13 TaxID=2997340 RepID=UPI00226E5167|nr:histidine phosphatase family protein [Frigidibacter sp. RF13]MCY1126626.1 histidine phosphatase family protein [Frigidibacter sp. RF13]
MPGRTATELILIRHAPTLAMGRLNGRTDVGADLSDAAALAALRDRLPRPDRLITSPARRCRETARAIWDMAPDEDPRLWEQDFGDWEGKSYAELPDIGPLEAADLARHRPPGGESFEDICARIHPALTQIAEAGAATLLAHAGTVRAALALALGSVAPALAFDVAPLSVTRLVRHEAGWQIGSVNERVAG